jgi:hypothetical protein
MTHKYINGFMCPLKNLTVCTLVPEEHRSHFVEGKEYQEEVDLGKSASQPIPQGGVK